MAYVGRLDSRLPFTLESNSIGTGGAVTIYWLKPGGFLDIELFPGTIAPHHHMILRRASRVIFEVSAPISGSTGFKLSQGGAAVDETIFGDALFVCDIV